MAQKGRTELHRRRTAKPAPAKTPVSKEEDAFESTDVLKGLLQCVAGIGGMALIMWLIFYLVMPPRGFSTLPDAETGTEVPTVTPPSPQETDILAACACPLTPTDQPCSRISSVRDLIVALRELSDWRSLGENLGVEPAKLDAFDKELEEAEHKKRGALRAWFEAQPVVACWEEVIKALQANEKDSKLAKELADKMQAN